MTAPDMSDLRALYVNCTLKRSPEPSHTQLLIDRSVGIMRNQGVDVDLPGPSTTTSPPEYGPT